MTDNTELIERGSKTAKRGFANERDIAEKFNNWKSDQDAQEWLITMEYDLEEIERVEAVVLPNKYKADIQVKLSIYLKEAISAENISIKLVSNPTGFNQVDKRWVDNYKDMWRIPPDVTQLLKYYTGENHPYKSGTRDSRRMFIDEFSPEEQELLIGFFETNKIMILTDIIKGRGRLTADWMMVALKSDENTEWVLVPISVALNTFGLGNVHMTKQGNIKFGQVGIQRKGGDGGRKTAQLLQFKINPAILFRSEER